MNSLISLALKSVDNGFAIFPLKSNSKIPATPSGFKNATKDREKIIAWWRANPNYNIGVATGLISGIAVVDIDVKNNAPGKKSIALIKGLVPDTFTVHTPSGGYHLYYSIKEKIRSRTGFIPGVDVKSEGGYVVGDGSRIGEDYYRATNSLPICPISEHLAREINRVNIPRFESSGEFRKKENVSLSVSSGNWHFPILREVGRMVARGYSDNDIHAVTDTLTLPGYSVESTRQEVSRMIAGARSKGFGRK